MPRQMNDGTLWSSQKYYIIYITVSVRQKGDVRAHKTPRVAMNTRMFSLSGHNQEANVKGGIRQEHRTRVGSRALHAFLLHPVLRWIGAEVQYKMSHYRDVTFAIEDLERKLWSLSTYDPEKNESSSIALFGRR